jgi:hypothetical protein
MKTQPEKRIPAEKMNAPLSVILFTMVEHIDAMILLVLQHIALIWTSRYSSSKLRGVRDLTWYQRYSLGNRMVYI